MEKSAFKTLLLRLGTILVNKTTKHKEPLSSYTVPTQSVCMLLASSSVLACPSGSSMAIGILSNKPGHESVCTKQSSLSEDSF